MGHDVHRINHVGDWGTQFGMLIEYIIESSAESTPHSTSQLKMSNLAVIYRKARERFNADETFQQRSRDRVVALQNGSDPETRRMWSEICEASRVEFAEIYEMLGVDKRLTERGESFYNYLLEDTVSTLIAKGIATESDGAICIFPDTHDKG